MIKQIIYNYCGLFSIVWAILIFVLCATPGQYLPSEEWLELIGFDKFVHASIFFILLSLAFLKAFKHQQSSFVFVMSFIFAFFYGVILEFMQANYFSNRSADFYDIAANTAGCFIAVLIFKKTKSIYKI
jgi:VanZ family protein